MFYSPRLTIRIGQIIQGFGSTTIETVQGKLYAFYAVGGGLMGFIYGLDIGIGRVYNLMGKLTDVPIMQNNTGQGRESRSRGGEPGVVQEKMSNVERLMGAGLSARTFLALHANVKYKLLVGKL